MKRRKSPVQERSRNTVDAILQATTYILLKDGMRGVTTNKVADRAGVNIASLYQYFPNKDALLLEIMRRHAHDTRRAVLEVLISRRSRPSLRDNVRAVVEATLAAHAVAPQLHTILTAEAMRMRLAPFETGVDEALVAEQTLWLANATMTTSHTELTRWMAATAIHAIVHTAVVERPQDVQSPVFADELTLLLTRFLYRR